jgi:leucyl aminopeptidase
MQISVMRSEAAKVATDILVLPIFSGKDFDLKKIKDIPDALRSRLEKTATAGKFIGKAGQQIHLQAEGMDILLMGVGEKKGDLSGVLREACGSALAFARKCHVKRVAFFLTGRELVKESVIENLALASILGDYAFDTFKKENSEKRLDEFSIIVDDVRDMLKYKKAVERAEVIADGVNVARDLVNTPAKEITPSHLAEAAKEIVKASGSVLKLTVLGRKECEKLGMNAYLAVSQGSEEEPKFIHLTYTPLRPSKRKIAVVGKGVTFDSGGLSLKPADGMMTMKCDMAGAAAVLGLFATLARLKPRVQIHGVIAATENMPSGKAIRPGDVVKSMNGKTIEILNTDAEGRLTLADAMTYIIRKEDPSMVIDLATLTGACVVALGEEIAGLMSNDRTLAKNFLTAAKGAGEKFWELPLEERYRSLVVSDIADLRNIATNRYGGTLTAGLFLEEFAEKKPWAHLDIAGPAFAEKPLSSYLGRGGTGFGVRSLVEFIKNLE